jgi:hypothetical protein
MDQIDGRRKKVPSTPEASTGRPKLRESAQENFGKVRAVLLCYPPGNERIFAYRTMRLLAAHLVQAGFHVPQFDYFGTGPAVKEIAVAPRTKARRGTGRLPRQGVGERAELARGPHPAPNTRRLSPVTKDREALLAFFDFPAEHRDHLARQTRSRPCSRQFVIGRCGRRDRCRRRPPS